MPAVSLRQKAEQDATDCRCRSTKLSTRRDALFGLSITLFRIFFHLQTHQLSAQIVQLIRPHMPKLGATYSFDGKKQRSYSKADEVEFRFLLGVYYLGQRRIFEASLSKSLQTTSSDGLTIYTRPVQ